MAHYWPEMLAPFVCEINKFFSIDALPLNHQSYIATSWLKYNVYL